MPTLRVGVVGVGYWGPKLVKEFQALDDVQVQRLCDIDPEALRTQTQQLRVPCPGAANIETLLNDTAHPVDAVVIATPPDTHFALAQTALSCGKHVFVEKPLATNPNDAALLCALAAKNQRTLFVDHTYCHDQVIQRIQNLWRQNYLGSVQHCQLDWFGEREKPKGPSVLWDSGPHALATLHFLNPLTKGSLSMSGVQTLSTGITATANVEVKASATAAHIHLAWMGQRWKNLPVAKAACVTLFGSKKTLCYEGSFGQRQAWITDAALSPEQWQALPEAGKKNLSRPLEDVDYRDEPLKNACQAFVDAVRHESLPLTDGYFGFQVVSLLHAAEQSVKTQTAQAVRYQAIPLG